LSGYTTTASVTSDQAAYNRLAYFALRPLLHFDQLATVKPTAQAMPGSSVVFQLYADLSVASTALNESVDVTPVALSDSQVTVTLVEQGNAVITTAKVRGTSFLNVDADAANIVGYNAGISMDTVARDVLKAGSNVRYGAGGTTLPTARNTVEPEDTLNANNVRRARTDLRGASVMAFGPDMYAALIHPDVAYDLRRETGAASWRDPHTYSQPDEIWNGEVGAFEGFRFIETERAPIFADAGSSTTLTDVYRTIFVGAQCLAKTWSSSVSAEYPQVVRGEVVDSLRRFVPVGWYQMAGYSIFRQAAVRAVESSSSVGVNA
jgi:N4-gp56 family major capsid protein